METRYTLKNKCMVNFMPPYYSVVIDACVMSVCGSIQKGIIFTFYSLNEDITVLKRLEKRAGRSQRKKITEGSSMKIVVLDGYTENPGDLSWDSLAALGELIVYDRTPADIILQRIGDADAVYTNKTPLTAETIAASPGLRFIGVLATGYNVVDVAAAKERGILVCNIPTYGTAAVAQFAIAMLLEICHHVAHHSDAVHAGRWTNNVDWCFWDYPLIELADKTMGIIGFGRIGQATGRIAQAMGMKVLAYDSYRNPVLENDNLRYAELDELLAASDVIALHCPLFPETQGIINKGTISKMKDGVIILNNSRGPLILEQDLADALNSGKVYAAGLDVVSTEPIRADNPLLTAKNCLITPHMSWAPRESRQRLMDIAVENLTQFIKGTPVNVVNL
jgi:glycerate dehydrogenase